MWRVVLPFLVHAVLAMTLTADRVHNANVSGSHPQPGFLLRNRSPSPGASPLRWQDVRAANSSGGQQPPYDTPSPNTAQPPSPWTGMLDSLRRSPPKVLQSCCCAVAPAGEKGFPVRACDAQHSGIRHYASTVRQEQHGEQMSAD